MLVPPFRVVLKTPVDSALHLSITMASADFCALNTAFGSGYVFRRLPHRPPWVPHVSFAPSTCLIYPIRFRVAIGLYLVKQTYPRMRPYMRFLFVRPELCPRVSRFPESSFLQILPHGRHPCFRLCPSRYRADSGLTPVRNVRRQAHFKKTGLFSQSSLRHFITYSFIYITYTTDFSPRVFSIRSMMPRVMTIIRVARAAMVGSK